MKYYILITSIFLTSTIVAMDSSYQGMLDRITNASKDHPCITVVNNSSKPLYMEVGDLEKDYRKSRMILQSNIQLPFSPYAHPFFLNKDHIQEGTTLNFFTEHPENKRENTKQLAIHIGGNSKIQFGDILHIIYHNNELNIDNIPTLKPNHNRKTLHKTTKRTNLQLTKRSNTIS